MPPGGYPPAQAPYPPAQAPYPQQPQYPHYPHGGYGQYPGYPPQNYPAYPSYGGYPVAPKNPAISLLVSFFIPGVGSMINGDVGKGVAILVGYMVSWVFTLVIIGIFGVFGFWVWGMVDAYQGAVEWNRRHGIVS
jgi:TM2 domain-containing membrane protein YozV